MREVTDFDSLFRSYYEPLFRYANQYVHDEDDCHDIVAAVFESVWMRFETINQATVKSFLYANVRNRCIDLLRHQGRHQQYIDFVRNHSETLIVRQDFEERQERQNAIAQALKSLDDKTRKIIIACLVDGKKYREVAEELGISLSSVKKRMVQALNQIRQS